MKEKYLKEDVDNLIKKYQETADENEKSAILSSIRQEVKLLTFKLINTFCFKFCVPNDTYFNFLESACDMALQKCANIFDSQKGCFSSYYYMIAQSQMSMDYFSSIHPYSTSVSKFRAYSKIIREKKQLIEKGYIEEEALQIALKMNNLNMYQYTMLSGKASVSIDDEIGSPRKDGDTGLCVADVFSEQTLGEQSLEEKYINRERILCLYKLLDKYTPWEPEIFSHYKSYGKTAFNYFWNMKNYTKESLLKASEGISNKNIKLVVDTFAQFLIFWLRKPNISIPQNDKLITDNDKIIRKIMRDKLAPFLQKIFDGKTCNQILFLNHCRGIIGEADAIVCDRFSILVKRSKQNINLRIHKMMHYLRERTKISDQNQEDSENNITRSQTIINDSRDRDRR